ncbi:hypothetical protein [Lysinibacter cavernae]|uniref:Uncharacterized protein n=1 Tax=Lysinibacter cavernae TaxID=1640652 RepID=A0A7X5TTV8_9MICO|nr:hypothetical protein [Lysinibacter cavernae]
MAVVDGEGEAGLLELEDDEPLEDEPEESFDAEVPLAEEPESFGLASARASFR